MRPQTNTLAASVRTSAKLQEKVDILKDAYKGEDCWIVATGPSAVAFDKEVLHDALKDKLVIAVKQAYGLFPDIVDFHVQNPCNLKYYEYESELPIRIAVIWPPGSEAWDAKWDISFRIPRCGRMVESSCWTKDFAKWELATTLDRPWGPGIMHEIGMYLPVHFGCKRVFTLGFDLEPIRGRHFWHEHLISMERDTVSVPANATEAMRTWLKSHDIEWYRIATPVGSQLSAPTICLDDALIPPYDDTHGNMEDHA